LTVVDKSPEKVLFFSILVAIQFEIHQFN